MNSGVLELMVETGILLVLLGSMVLVSLAMGALYTYIISLILPNKTKPTNVRMTWKVTHTATKYSLHVMADSEWHARAVAYRSMWNHLFYDIPHGVNMIDFLNPDLSTVEVSNVQDKELDHA